MFAQYRATEAGAARMAAQRGGIVEVEVRFRRVIQPSRFGDE